ncbi:MAG: Serine/threonine-protein kinase PknD [Planctomycetes bacterium]|nr:Serine/threonine-protein kinase PknD [Planctomycetota bacterium]
MPALSPDEVLRYLNAKGFLSSAEVELVKTRWNVERDGPLLQWIGRQKLLPEEVAADIIQLLADNRLEGLEPSLPGLVLLALAGKGGRGSVYRAWQPSLKRVVAVKILSKELAQNREYLQRFLREAKVASKVSHKNIVRAFDINKHGGNVYLVMEYVAGASVGDILRQRGKVEPAHAMEIAQNVAEAIAYVSQVGIVHRDIKPDNIMIDRKGRVRLCDLGLARPSGATQLTSPMVAQGTPAYMAPEAAMSPEIDSQADVYSLGVTLFRMLLGRLPFDHPDPVEVLRMHIEEEPRGLEGGELPGALSDLIRRMLDKDPRRRPPARELPREIAALIKAIPSLDKSSLWELIEGGEPTLPVPGQPGGLALEPTGELGFVVTQAPPAQKPWEGPQAAAAPRPAAPPAAGKLTGVGFGTMALALVLCLLYIVFYTLDGPPEPRPDPEAEKLRVENSDLRQQLKSERESQTALSDFMARAGQQWRAEQAELAKINARDPRRERLEAILVELDELRALQTASELPGAGD